MGECLISRRGGELYELPTLNSSYPADKTVVEGKNVSAEFEVIIATAGKPAEYTYQWYVNGSKVSGATSSSYKKTGLTTTGTYTVYCEVTNKAGIVTSRVAKLTVQSYIPEYTYANGTAVLTKDDANYNWELDFQTSGTFTPKRNITVDIFCVGAGGGGGAGSSDNGTGKGGGGGGWTTTVKKVALTAGTAYTVTVGAGAMKSNGGASSFKKGSTSLCTADGGKASTGFNGGNGGSGGGSHAYVDGDALTLYGGAGGSNGSAGTGVGDYTGGTGQGTTTRKFGKSTGTLYAGGGGGAAYSNDTSIYGKGGSGGGGNGGVGRWDGRYKSPTNGTTNTGGGGGGEPTCGAGTGTKGGSGLVSIRNAQ